MRRLRLYLETSVWNVFFDSSDSNRQAYTQQFFENLPQTSYESCISEVTLQEIERAQEPRRTQIHDLIRRVRPLELPLTDEMNELAEDYSQQGIFPSSSFIDALHVACATIQGADVVVSWNLKHIANVRRQELVQGVNLVKGYNRTILLTTPLEVLTDE